MRTIAQEEANADAVLKQKKFFTVSSEDPVIRAALNADNRDRDDERSEDGINSDNRNVMSFIKETKLGEELKAAKAKRAENLAKEQRKEDKKLQRQAILEQKKQETAAETAAAARIASVEHREDDEPLPLSEPKKGVRDLRGQSLPGSSNGAIQVCVVLNVISS